MNKLPPRDVKGHKGTFGTVAIAAGSITDRKVMVGGAVFAAKAALRSGVGMVALIGQKELLAQLLAEIPQAIGIVTTKNYSREANRWNSIVVGPALGSEKDNAELIRNLLELKLPTVIDADALNEFSKNPELFSEVHDQCVLTPQPVEFSRLAKALGMNDPIKIAEKLGCIIVLKDSKTLVTDGEKKWQLNNPNPALATGGTGDVLAGLIGGLMAQYSPDKLPLFECAKLGVTIHSKAATKWRIKHGSSGLIINELLDIILEVMETMRHK